MGILVQRQFSVAPDDRREFERQSRLGVWENMRHNGAQMIAYGTWAFGGRGDVVVTHSVYESFDHWTATRAWGEFATQSARVEETRHIRAIHAGRHRLIRESSARIIDYDGEISEPTPRYRNVGEPLADPPPTFGPHSIMEQTEYSLQRGGEDTLVSILRDAGIENAIIDIGGDLTVLGHINGRPARIGIRSPRSDDTLAWLDVMDGETVVTSGDYERFFEVGGRRYQHILDPRNGYPVAHTISATVLHQDPVLADAAATALLVAGPGAFEELCAVLGVDEALIVSASGDLRLTQAMEKRLNWPNR